VDPAGPGKNVNQLGGDGVACRVGWLQQLCGSLEQPHGDGGSATRGHSGGPPEPLDSLLVAGSGPDRQVGGHLARRGRRSRQRATRLEVEGPTYG